LEVVGCCWPAPLTSAGTDIEYEVLFDAAQNGGRLDWADVIPRIEGQGPLLVLAHTDKGYVKII
jgi:aminopeptidase-like protein